MLVDYMPIVSHFGWVNTPFFWINLSFGVFTEEKNLSNGTHLRGDINVWSSINWNNVLFFGTADGEVV